MASWLAVLDLIKPLVQDGTILLQLSSKEALDVVQRHYVRAHGGHETYREGLFPEDAARMLDYFKLCPDERRKREEYPHLAAMNGTRQQCIEMYRGYPEWRPYLSQGIMRMILRKIRCSTMIMKLGDAPRAEVLCMGCSMRTGFNPRSMNKDCCALCGQRVHPTGTAEDRWAYRCRRHAPMQWMGSTEKCFLCGHFANINTAKVLLCRSCKPPFSPNFCCHLGD